MRCSHAAGPAPQLGGVHAPSLDEVPAADQEALGELTSRAESLLECFAAVSDPRDSRGIRH